MDIQIKSSLDLLRSSQISQSLTDLDNLLYSICQIAGEPRKTNTRGGGSTRRIRNENYSAQLYERPEIKEFLRLQDCHIYNIVGHLMEFLLSGSGKNGGLTDELFVRSLEVVQGVCLLHYQSRQTFSSDVCMDFLISSLEKTKNSVVQIALVNTIVSIMVREVYNIRKFEQLNGLAVICSLFKDKATAKDVKLQVLEFLFFYLIPETRGNKASKIAGRTERRTTEDKQVLLGRYLSNVSGLVRELNMSRPFGDLDLEW